MTQKLLVAAIVVGVGLFVYLMRDQFSLERIVESERQLRAFIGSQPWRAFPIGFVLYTVVSLFPGMTGKAAVVGWLFGFWSGLSMVLGGLTIAGMGGFTVARYLLREGLHARWGERLASFDRALERDGAVFLLTLRLLHVPFTLVNYTAGVSTVRLGTFTWTTAVGLIPGTVVLVGLGAGLPSLDELVERGVMSLVGPEVLVGLLALAFVPWIVRGTLRRWKVGVDDDLGGTTKRSVPARGRSV